MCEIVAEGQTMLQGIQVHQWGLSHSLVLFSGNSMFWGEPPKGLLFHF